VEGASAVASAAAAGSSGGSCACMPSAAPSPKPSRVPTDSTAGGAVSGAASPVALIDSLLQVGAIWSSPLARCVQTAMVALQPLTANGAVSVELKPMARERRELTNLHTSIGNSFGEHIRTRCLAKSREVSKSDEESLLAELEKVPITTSEVESQWWSTNPEPEKDFQARMQELLTQVQYAPHDSILLVAHNDTLQELLRNCLHEDAREQHADLVAHLAKEPAPPCSLIGFTLDFRRTGGKPITELALLGRVDGPGQVDLFGRVDALRRASGRPR